MHALLAIWMPLEAPSLIPSPSPSTSSHPHPPPPHTLAPYPYNHCVHEICFSCCRSIHLLWLDISFWYGDGIFIYKEGEREQALPLITCESYSPVEEVCLLGRLSGVVSIQYLAADESNSWYSANVAIVRGMHVCLQRHVCSQSCLAVH